MTDAELQRSQNKGGNFSKTLFLGFTLFVVTALTGLILGGVQYVTADAIAKTIQKEKDDALKAVLPDADSFASIPLTASADQHIKDVQEARKGSDVIGWCVAVTAKGYSGAIDILAGVRSDGTLSAVRILNHSETPGLGAKAQLPPFYGQFENKKDLPLNVVKQPVSAQNEIQAISGATITSSAVASGVNIAVEYCSSLSVRKE